jgi:hypothetical protein
MNQAKYWLLELVCESKFPLSILVKDELDMIVNKTTTHGLSYTELVDSLELLFAEGLLIADLCKNPNDFGVPIEPSRQDIEDAIARKIEIHYGLTALGGEYWETIYQPNWKYFITGWSSYDGMASFSGSERDVVEQYVLALTYTTHQQMIDGSAVWEPQKPYPATYWKALPSGWQVTFKFRTSDLDLGVEIPLEYREINTLIDNWYTDPFIEY